MPCYAVLYHASRTFLLFLLRLRALEDRGDDDDDDDDDDEDASAPRGTRPQWPQWDPVGRGPSGTVSTAGGTAGRGLPARATSRAAARSSNLGGCLRRNAQSRTTQKREL